MRRTLNFTGRHKIPRDRVGFILEEDGSGRNFGVTAMNLSGIAKFRGDEKIYIEAYYENTWMRFSYGTVNNPHPPASSRLEDLDGTQVVYFRVKVVDETEDHGKIIAIADQISVVANDEQQNKESLLPVNYTDLKSDVWRIAILDDGPVLEINNSINGVESFVRYSPLFKSLVLPQAFRQILTDILLVQAEVNTEDEDDWRCKWLKFAVIVSGQELPQKEEELEKEFINQCLESFTNQQKSSQLLDTFLNEPTGAKNENLE